MHDYHPSGDFEVIPLSQLGWISDTNRAAVSGLIDKLTEEIVLPLGFSEGWDVFFVDPAGLQGNKEWIPLGIFCNGTSSRPIIGIDVQAIDTQADMLGIDFLTEVEVTLVHELAHAYQETLGVELDDAAEAPAEAFAQHWVKTGLVNLNILHKAIRVRPTLQP